MEESITFAKKYIEDLLSFFGLNTDVYATSEDGEVVELHVPSTHLNGFLIGQNAETLRALQYIVSMALKNAEMEINRVNVDVADYKKQRAHRLEDRAKEWLDEVKRSGNEKHLPPMNPADRRTIHKLAGEYGLETTSEGFGHERHIVLKPTGSAMDDETEIVSESESTSVKKPKTSKKDVVIETTDSTEETTEEE